MSGDGTAVNTKGWYVKMPTRYKVIVAHPGRQHSFRLASALKHANMLDEYITTVYYKRSSKLLRAIAALGGEDNARRVRARNNNDLNDDEVKQFLQLRGLAETLMWRSRDPYRFDRYFQRTSMRFGRRVASEAVARQVDAVVTYGGHGAECFDQLKTCGARALKVIDLAGMPKSLLACSYEEIMSDGLHDDLRVEERQSVWGDRSVERRAKELALADYCLVPSDYVRNGLIRAGVPEHKISKVPYGCNFGSYEVERKHEKNETIEFLFVGQVIVRKGALELLRAFKQLTDANCHLTVVGKFDPDAWYVKELMDLSNVTMCGLLLHDEVRAMFEQSDVFVLPTYNEGMSLSCLEAMGLGLPVISTPNAGVSDLLIDGETGYTISVADEQSLLTALRFFLDDPSSVRRMGKKARSVAERYTWDAYEGRIDETFSKWLVNPGAIEGC